MTVTCLQCLGTGRDLTYMTAEQLGVLPSAHQEMYRMAGEATDGLWINNGGYRVRLHPRDPESYDGDRITDSKECLSSMGRDPEFIAFAKNNARYFVRHAWLMNEYAAAFVLVGMGGGSGRTTPEEGAAMLKPHLEEMAQLNQWRDQMMLEVAKQEKNR